MIWALGTRANSFLCQLRIGLAFGCKAVPSIRLTYAQTPRTPTCCELVVQHAVQQAGSRPTTNLRQIESPQRTHNKLYHKSTNIEGQYVQRNRNVGDAVQFVRPYSGN